MESYLLVLWLGILTFVPHGDLLFVHATVRNKVQHRSRRRRHLVLVVGGDGRRERPLLHAALSPSLLQLRAALPPLLIRRRAAVADAPRGAFPGSDGVGGVFHRRRSNGRRSL